MRFLCWFFRRSSALSPSTMTLKVRKLCRMNMEIRRSFTCSPLPQPTLAAPPPPARFSAILLGPPFHPLCSLFPRFQRHQSSPAGRPASGLPSRRETTSRAIYLSRDATSRTTAKHPTPERFATSPEACRHPICFAPGGYLGAQNQVGNDSWGMNTGRSKSPAPPP